MDFFKYGFFQIGLLGVSWIKKNYLCKKCELVISYFLEYKYYISIEISLHVLTLVEESQILLF